MTEQNHRRMLVASAMAIALAACGGGGGGGSGSGMVSTPTPPPPPPSPTPTPYFPMIFPSIMTTTDFAALGYENFNLATSSSQLKEDFAVRYDAAAQAYVIDLPSASPGRFSATGEGPFFWSGVLLDQPLATPSVSIRKPAHAGFVYTTFGHYYEGALSGGLHMSEGAFAFGLATPAGSVPVSGSATYSAAIDGKTLDQNYFVHGTAELQFNFAAGTLAGSLSPILNGPMDGGPLGRYDFVNTIYSVGATSFSGGLRHETNNLTGSFNGLFTGPQAQELMARWTAHYADQNGGGTKEMFGVLVGRRP